jgi:Holliday junction resolvase RusA-like endonuclease
MAEYKLVIPGALPGLNEYSTLERRNRYQAATMKKQAEAIVIAEAKRQLRGVKLTGPVDIDCYWFERNRRRDKDNIAFAKKFIFDGLVNSGVLRDDGWDEINDIRDKFAVDPKRPRVEVVIREVS